jgi:hypothetical protein
VACLEILHRTETRCSFPNTRESTAKRDTGEGDKVHTSELIRRWLVNETGHHWEFNSVR